MDGGTNKKSDRQQQQKRNTGHHDPVRSRKPTLGHPIDHSRHSQAKEQQNRHDIQEPLPDSVRAVKVGMIH